MLRPLRLNTGRLYVDLVAKVGSIALYAVHSAPDKFDHQTVGTKSEAQAHLRRLQAQAAPVATPPPVQAPPPPVVAPPRPVVTPALRVQETVVGAGYPALEVMLDARKSLEHWKNIARSGWPGIVFDRETLSEIHGRSSEPPFARAEQTVRQYVRDGKDEAEMSGDDVRAASFKAAVRAVDRAHQHLNQLIEDGDREASQRLIDYETALQRGLQESMAERGEAYRRAEDERKRAEMEAALRPLNAAVAELATLRRELDARRRQWEESGARNVPLPGGDKAFLEKSDAIGRRVNQLENSILNMQHELRRAGFLQ